ncbi:LacI family DNA-binding transcriptional regulator [Hufsiella ginkgonis]|uniref:Substrate-binding domain-containing protein n=1 Tax=Hufsiella ginkgonis TaxID=2695274 RepID=A0A7K1XXR2_9SPHI|nr:substrate-binding domain-containing protein [Hufsiella ginkgonis]MXV15627.1 substrate-binding domain-containing protein [Hufsiella ginkgonis]
MKKRISIRDLAAQLDVSVTTISFILNGRAEEKRISAQLVERVLKHVKEVGYRPNSLARSLRTGKSHIICLMVEDIANPFFANIARLIEERAYKSGYKIMYCSTDNSLVKTREMIHMFRERHVDGFIIAPPEGVDEEINALINDGRPVILFDRTLPQVSTDHVMIDNAASTYLAVKHLVAEGFKNIAFITLDSLQSQMQGRLEGYERALREHNLNFHIKEVAFTLDEENTIRHIAAFLQRKKEVDAILFGTNYLAIRGLKAINQLKGQIAPKLGIVAFDDHDLFELNSPSITAIAQPIEEMADKVITLLLNKLNSLNKKKPNQSVLMNTKLVIRESSKGAGPELTVVSRASS